MKKLATLLLLAAACGPGLIEFPIVPPPSGQTPDGGGTTPASPAVCAQTPGQVYCGGTTCETLGIQHCGANDGSCVACSGAASCLGGTCVDPVTTCGKGILACNTGCNCPTKQVVAGGNSSCGINVQGGTNAVWCWGANDTRQLGPGADATVASSSAAYWIPALDGATAVALGTGHGCAVVGGNVKCWGRNDAGQLGVPASGSIASPVTVPNVSGATAVAAGDRHSCAITADGAVCWGADGDTGILGGTSPITAAKGATKIVAGANHTCAMLAASVLCWGANDFGQIGNGTTQASGGVAPFPVTFTDATGITDVAAGSNHTCAMLAGSTIDGTKQLRCWGANGSHQIANDTSAVHSLPTSIQPFNTKNLSDAVVAGRAHTCVVRGTDGDCFGDNSSGQLAVPAGIGLPIASGGDHTCLVDAASNIRCFGRNASNELGTFGP